MHKQSSGILVYRRAVEPEVFLVHPGGPFWQRKEDGAWSIPKGEFSEGEDPFQAARREFEEETGLAITGNFEALDPVKQPSGKVIYVWIVTGELDPNALKSNLFSMQWPPRSGIIQKFPEVDRAAWFSITVARRKIVKGQIPFIDELDRKLENIQLGTAGADGQPSRPNARS